MVRKKNETEANEQAGENAALTNPSNEQEPVNKPRLPRRMARESDVANQNAGAAADASQAQVPPPPAPRANSKISQVIALLERPEGATLAELVEATGWLPHTTRAALTGLKKKGRSMARDKRGETTCYRIEASA